MLCFTVHSSVATLAAAKLGVRWYDMPELVVSEGQACTRADAVVTYERTLARMTGFRREPTRETHLSWPTLPGVGPQPELR